MRKERCIADADYSICLLLFSVASPGPYNEIVLRIFKGIATAVKTNVFLALYDGRFRSLKAAKKNTPYRF